MNPVLPNFVKASSSAFSENPNKFSVHVIEKDQQSVTWRISIQVDGEDIHPVSGELVIPHGMAHLQMGQKLHNSQAGSYDVQATGGVYQFSIPEASGSYVFDLTTSITDPEEMDYRLSGKATFEDGTYRAFDEVRIVPDTKVNVAVTNEFQNVDGGVALPDVTVHLLNGGSIVDSSVLSGGQDSHTFDDLRKYSEEGALNSYSTMVEPVENFETIENGNHYTHTYQAPKVEEPVKQEEKKEESKEDGEQSDDPDPVEEKKTEREAESKEQEVEKNKEGEKESLDQVEQEKQEEKKESSESKSEDEEDIDAFLNRIASMSEGELENLSKEDLDRLENLSEKEIERLMEMIERDSSNLSSSPGFNEEGVMSNDEAPGPAIASAPRMMQGFSMMSTDFEWGEPGSLNLSKEATPTGEYAEWEVELNIDGINARSSADIVLVMDQSGSMASGQRLPKMKEAASEFVNALLGENSLNRIGIVTFSEYSSVEANLTGPSGKGNLLSEINSISAGGGTNIQQGIYSAKNMLNGSSADQQVIVLLSDGEPTYSHPASNANSYSWANANYNFVLSGFDYSNGSRIGSGSSYNLPGQCTQVLWFPWNCTQDTYRVNGNNVETNGIGTISEAKSAMDQGNTMYSIGLETGNNTNATNVLLESQNAGYFVGGSDDLSAIFNDISSDVSNAATDAVVIDPMGDYVDLVEDGSYNSANWEVSQGTVSWDANTETFTWDVGNIVEGNTAWFKYKVKMDLSMNPDSDTLYPTNKETPLNYTDINGNSATKQFNIPEVSIGPGSILVNGYRVNIDGDPIDSNGNVVGSPQDAEQLYSYNHEENGDDALPFNVTYSIPANTVNGYVQTVGDDPTDVTLTAISPNETVWFGYAFEGDFEGGDVTAKYVDEDGNELADPEIFSGLIGESYQTEAKEIEGYELVSVDGDEEGTFTTDEQTVTYTYAKIIGSLTVYKVDENGDPLNGATFELKNSDNELVDTLTVEDDGTIVFEGLEIGDYTLVEVAAPTGYRLNGSNISITISAENRHQEETVINYENGWDIPETGGIGSSGFYALGILLMIGALYLIIRNRRVE